jgi:aryl-alcohol dehydrogenase-like predicted oxidoreductase
MNLNGTDVKKRVLGRTGFEISEIGLGAWVIGGNSYGKVEEKDAAQCIETYLEKGGNFIDTARGYASSEEIIGRELIRVGMTDNVFIASKTPNSSKKESIPKIREDLETSLRLLKRDYLDLYYLHNPADDYDNMNYVLEEFMRLKDEGKIRAIGASIKGPDVSSDTIKLCRQYIGTGMIDAIQVIYSIFRNETGEVFEEANANGVGIVARTVLENGFLTGKYSPGHTFSEGDHRLRWSKEKLNAILEEVAKLKEYLVKSPYESLTQASIAFSLESKYVSSAIVGAKNASQVNNNLSVLGLPSIPSDTVKTLLDTYRAHTDLFNIGS